MSFTYLYKGGSKDRNVYEGYLDNLRISWNSSYSYTTMMEKISTCDMISDQKEFIAYCFEKLLYIALVNIRCEEYVLKKSKTISNGT